MAWLGVRSYRFTGQTNEFFNSIIPYYLLLVGISYTLSSFVYSYMKWPRLEMMSDAILIGLGGVQIICIFFCFGSKMRTIKEVHLKLQQIVDEQGDE